MSDTRSGEQVSPQIGTMGEITVRGGLFSLPDGQCFLIKNDGESAVTLEVQLAGMTDGMFVATRFDVGWNPEIVRVVKQAPTTGANLKWGY